MGKYVIKRNDVYAGSLMKELNAKCIVTDQSGKKLNEEELRKEGINLMKFSCGIICRGMLFTIKDYACEDLIYTTPSNYAIEDMEPSVETPKGFMIKDWCSMDPILEYLGYGEELTQRELDQVYRKFICKKRWLDKHMELFGWKKDKIGYASGGTAIISMDLYHKLNSISCTKNGEPHRDEPGFELIKKRKNKE